MSDHTICGVSVFILAALLSSQTYAVNFTIVNNGDKVEAFKDGVLHKTFQNAYAVRVDKNIKIYAPCPSGICVTGVYEAYPNGPEFSGVKPSICTTKVVATIVENAIQYTSTNDWFDNNIGSQNFKITSDIDKYIEDKCTLKMTAKDYGIPRACTNLQLTCQDWAKERYSNVYNSLDALEEKLQADKKLAVEEAKSLAEKKHKEQKLHAEQKRSSEAKALAESKAAKQTILALYGLNDPMVGTWRTDQHKSGFVTEYNLNYDQSLNVITLDNYSTNEKSVLEYKIKKAKLKPTIFTLPEVARGEFEKKEEYEKRKANITETAKSKWMAEENNNKVALSSLLLSSENDIKKQSLFAEDNVLRCIHNIADYPVTKTITYDPDKEVFVILIVSNAMPNFGLYAEVNVPIADAKKVKDDLLKMPFDVYMKILPDQSYKPLGVIFYKKSFVRGRTEGVAFHGKVTATIGKTSVFDTNSTRHSRVVAEIKKDQGLKDKREQEQVALEEKRKKEKKKQELETTERELKQAKLDSEVMSKADTADYYIESGQIACISQSSALAVLADIQRGSTNRVIGLIANKQCFSVPQGQIVNLPKNITKSTVGGYVLISFYLNGRTLWVPEFSVNSK